MEEGRKQSSAFFCQTMLLMQYGLWRYSYTTNESITVLFVCCLALPCSLGCISASPTSTAYIMLKSELENGENSLCMGYFETLPYFGSCRHSIWLSGPPSSVQTKSEGFSLMKQRSFRRCFIAGAWMFETRNFFWPRNFESLLAYREC